MGSGNVAVAIAIVAAALVFGAWLVRRERARRNRARHRHPATPPPVSFEPAEDEDGRTHWRVTARHGLAPIALDMVMFRPSSGEHDWTSEPFIDPVVLEGGASAILPSIVADPTSAHDVVVAWTLRHPSGDIAGSRSFSVHPPSAVDLAGDIDPPTHRSVAGHWFTPVVVMVATVLVLVSFLAVLGLFHDMSPGSVDADDTEGSSTTVVAAPPTAPSNSVASPGSVTTTAGTTPTASNPPGSTAPPSAPPPSTRPPSTSPTSVPGTSTPTTAATTTTTPSTTSPSTTVGDGPRIDAVGRIEDCNVGSNCLVVGFTVMGLPQEGNYTCAFDDGDRFVFEYIGGGGETACASSSADPAITIEIDGVRSSTITRSALTGR